MGKIFVCVIIIFFLLGCKKEKQIKVPKHVFGNVYVTEKMSESEYKKMKTEQRISEIKSFYEREKIEKGKEMEMYFQEEINIKLNKENNSQQIYEYCNEERPLRYTNLDVEGIKRLKGEDVKKWKERKLIYRNREKGIEIYESN